MKWLSDTANRLAKNIQLTNILWCVVYVSLLVVLYLDLMVWRPN